MGLIPMKQRFFIRLNLFLTLVFLLTFIIILFSVDPFEASRFLIIAFYLVLFFLILSILNLIGKIPLWVRILISLSVIILLFLRKGRF